MRWKIIVVNAGVLIVVGLLTFVLLWTSLSDILANPAERKQEVEQALRAASSQLSLDGLRLERWLERRSSSDALRSVYSVGSPQARSEAATGEANRLRDAAVGEPAFARMAPTLVLFVDAQGIVLGRNGSVLMRGENLAAVYPSLASTLKEGTTGSGIWVNRERQEQLLASFAPIAGDDGKSLGAVVVGTPLNDERLARTSELTSGHPLILAIVGETTLEFVAKSPRGDAATVSAASGPTIASAAKMAVASGGIVRAESGGDRILGATPVLGYGGPSAVLIAGVAASRVGSVWSLLWPVFAVTGLGLVLVIIAGNLLGNYISGPVSELEDGLLAIINGNSALRFQIEHDELGGLVFRINSLLNALMGVPEDTTDDQGRPSHGPRAQDFQEALSVDESAVAGAADPSVAQALASEPAETYFRRLFEEYISAKRQLGDPVDHITFEAFSAKIRLSEQEMTQKHGRPVRYQVQLRGNSVVLNAVPLP